MFWAQDRGLKVQRLGPALAWSRHGHSIPSLPYLSPIQAEIDIPLLEETLVNASRVPGTHEAFRESKRYYTIYITWHRDPLMLQEMKACKIQHVYFLYIENKLALGECYRETHLTAALSITYSILTCFIVKLVWSSQQTLDQDFPFRSSMPCFCCLGKLAKVALPLPMPDSTYKIEITILISSVEDFEICSREVPNEGEILLLHKTWILLSVLAANSATLKHLKFLSIFWSSSTTAW